jgi:hypothetical protein
MKVGFSFSRCVRDIIDGKVDLNDVMVIIARTDFDPNDDQQWDNIWDGYHYGGGMVNAEWHNYPDSKDKFHEVALELWHSGRLHQPRKFGSRPATRREIWMEIILPPEELEHNLIVKDAWENFQAVAALSKGNF